MSDALHVSWDALLDSTAGTVPKGKALTKTVAGKWVVATTANRAVWGAGQNIWGVSLTDGAADQTVRVAHAGLVPLSVVGTLPGSGTFVEVDADGDLTRGATITANNTIGNYKPNGDVELLFSLLSGAVITGPTGSTGATGATGPTGPTGAAGGITGLSTGRSYVVAHNGTDWTGRRGVYNFLDWGPDETGVTNCLDLLRTAMNEVPNHSDLFIPLPSGFFRLELGSSTAASTLWPILYYDDNERGNKRGIRIICEGGPFNSGRRHFTVFGANPSGTAAKCTAYSNGGSGDSHQTWELGGSANILAADAARWKGRFFRTWNAADNDNNGAMLIVDVPSDNVIRVHNFNITPTASDNGIGGSGPSPTVVWTIEEPVIDLRSKDVSVERASFTVGANAKIWTIFELNHPPGTSGATNVRNRFIECSFSNDNAAPATQFVTDYFNVARRLLPSHAGNFAHTARVGLPGLTNGLGELQYGEPPQVDTNIWEKCKLTYARRSGVAFHSPSGQAKENRFIECQCASSTVQPMRYAVCVPDEDDNATRGNAHWDMKSCAFGFIRDACSKLGGTGSKQFLMEGCYGEIPARLLHADTNSSNVAIKIQDCSVGFDELYLHKSGTWIESNGAGPLVVDAGNFSFGGDVAPWHIRLLHTSTTLVNTIAIRDVQFQGSTTCDVRISAQSTTFRGPYRFAGTEKLGFKVDGGAQVDITFSQANFTTACGHAVNLDKVHAWEVASLINHYVTGAAAWGDGDDSSVKVMSATMSTSGSIQVQAPGSGTDANAQLGFPTTLTAHLAASRLGKDSSGLVEWSTGAGTTGKVHLKVDAHLMNNASVSQSYAIVNKVINGTSGQGAMRLENVEGISQTNGIPAKNLFGTVTVTGGTRDSTTWTFDRVEEDANYEIYPIPQLVPAAAAADSWVPETITKNTTGCSIKVRVDPGGSEVVTFKLELRR